MRIFLLMLMILPLHAELYLRDNLRNAKAGDFIVTAQSKNYTLLHIYEKSGQQLTIQEITIPQAKFPQMGWKEWVRSCAQGYTSWVKFEIDLVSGSVQKFYGWTGQEWREMPSQDNFLSTLLNLRLEKIPLHERKRIGPPSNDGPDLRALWKPKLTFEGKTYSDVPFDAWQTLWPKDGSELSGKLIEIFTPENSSDYPAYFPYWLQISGMVGKAKVRIIDSGTGLLP